jgi:hypothetical protein
MFPQHAWETLFHDLGTLCTMICFLRIYKVRGKIYFNPGTPGKDLVTVKSFLISGRKVLHHGTGAELSSRDVQAVSGITGHPLSHMDTLKIVVINYSLGFSHIPINILQHASSIGINYRNSPAMSRNLGLLNQGSYRRLHETIGAQRLLRTPRGVFFEGTTHNNNRHFTNYNLFWDFDLINQALRNEFNLQIADNIRQEAFYITNNFIKLSTIEQNLLLAELTNNRQTPINLHNTDYTPLPESYHFIRSRLGFDSPIYSDILATFTY